MPKIEIIRDSPKPELSRNGGCYNFTTTYEQVGSGEWDKQHFTTAEFDFCRTWGVFTSCHDCGSWDKKNQDCRDANLVSTERFLAELLEAAKEESAMVKVF